MTKTFLLPSFLYRPLFHEDMDYGLEEEEIDGIFLWVLHNKVGKCVEVNTCDYHVRDDHDMRDIFLPSKCSMFTFEVEDDTIKTLA